jgi:hypothetical protein
LSNIQDIRQKPSFFRDVWLDFVVCLPLYFVAAGSVKAGGKRETTTGFPMSAGAGREN